MFAGMQIRRRAAERAPPRNWYCIWRELSETMVWNPIQQPLFTTSFTDITLPQCSILRECHFLASCIREHTKQRTFLRDVRPTIAIYAFQHILCPWLLDSIIIANFLLIHKKQKLKKEVNVVPSCKTIFFVCFKKI